MKTHPLDLVTIVPSIVIYPKTRNYVAHLSVSHIFGRFLCHTAFISFFFFLHFPLFSCFIHKITEHVHTLPDYLLRIYVEFPLNIYYRYTLRTNAKKEGQTPTILVRMNVCLIGQDTRISHCRCICMCMCVYVGMLIPLLSFFFLLNNVA